MGSQSSRPSVRYSNSARTADPASCTWPDVMEADVPFKARSVEDVSQPTGRVVTLEHQYALACRFGEQRGGAQSADARANDDRVER